MAKRITFNKENWTGETVEVIIFRNHARTKEFRIEIDNVDECLFVAKARIYERGTTDTLIEVYTLRNMQTEWVSQLTSFNRQHENPFVLAAIMAYNLI